MELQKVFCTNCGTEITVNTDKDFCFCLECGNKIVLSNLSNSDSRQSNNSFEQREQTNNTEIDKKLEEVEFYYKISLEKKEYGNFYSEPFYYIKAQDILVDLSELYPNDYRIWWELCKPIDWLCPSKSNDVEDKYTINEGYFNRALDKAELSKKRELIEEHDRYIKYKEEAKTIAKKRFEEEEKKRKEKELEEQKIREEQLEKARKEQSEKAKELELQEMHERQENEKKMRSERETSIALSTSLWADLNQKKYSAIDNTYFTLTVENNQTIIGVFKLMSNMLYLSAFRIDGNKSNTIYQEQTMAIQFDESGHGIKFDRTPIRIKGLLPPENILILSYNSSNKLLVNNIPLQSNQEYINGIIKSAKKPLISFKKIFI